MTTGLPGLVDLQVNGYGGVDFSGEDLTEEGFAGACRSLARLGVTALCPTVITSPEGIYRQNLAIIGRVAKREEFADLVVGIHLEGPFISPEPGAVGAHNPAWTQVPSIELLETMQAWAGGQIRILTLAAELPGAAELARRAVGMGIAVFLGHQMANLEEHIALARAGAKAITHLGNGIPESVQRYNNPVLHGLAVDELAATIIADGHHLPAHLIRTIVRCKGIDNVAVVSDASPLAGMPPGEYVTLGNRVRLEPSGRVVNPEKGFMVGSSATMVDCLAYLESREMFSREELAKLVYSNPLRLIGRHG